MNKTHEVLYIPSKNKVLVLTTKEAREIESKEDELCQVFIKKDKHGTKLKEVPVLNKFLKELAITGLKEDDKIQAKMVASK